MPKITQPANASVSDSLLSRSGPVPFPLQVASLSINRTTFPIFNDGGERVKISYADMPSLIQDEAQID